MKAEEMRQITEQAKENIANKFWEEYKDVLFKSLKSIAECGHNSITIKYDSDLGITKQGCDWLNSKHLRDKVKKELEQLNYKFSYSDARQGNYIIISW